MGRILCKRNLATKVARARREHLLRQMLSYLEVGLKVLFVSLGCDKNLVDSEMMIGMLEDDGFEITNDENEAEAVVINTCAFILDAKQESIETILEFVEARKTGRIKALIVAGCLAQRYADEIHNEIPEVDALIGTASFDEIVGVLKNTLDGASEDVMKDIHAPAICGKRRVLTQGGHSAYLKVAEGCDKKCTYCAIPSFRGSYRSVPMEKLIAEAQQLAGNGVKELILVAQEITVYGQDLYGRKSLPELIKKLAKIDDIAWIRLLYCYPEEIDDELIATIRDEEKVCHYLDMPIQHASDHILQKMGRRTNREFLEKLIAKLRHEIPDICLRTTLITGFPGETEEDFIDLYNFVDESEFDRLGVFAYSAEEGTIAATMPNQVPEDIKEARKNEIMELQQEIAFEKAENMNGRRLTVMIEGRLVEDNVLVGRSYMDAPDVDGYIFIDSDKDYDSGTILDIMITGSSEYDLLGQVITGGEDEFTK